MTIQDKGKQNTYCFTHKLEAASGIVNAICSLHCVWVHFRFRKLCTSLDSILQIFGYKCLGEGDEQTGGFFGGNVGNVEVHQARISDGVLNFPTLGILHY